MTDHKDRNPLNNCWENLRFSSKSQNAANRERNREKKSSSFKGVYRTPKRWNAKIGVDMKMIHIGNFDIEEQAARAYDKAAVKYFGPFAKLNFPVS